MCIFCYLCTMQLHPEVPNRATTLGCALGCDRVRQARNGGVGKHKQKEVHQEHRKLHSLRALPVNPQDRLSTCTATLLLVAEVWPEVFGKDCRGVWADMQRHGPICTLGVMHRDHDPHMQTMQTGPWAAPCLPFQPHGGPGGVCEMHHPGTTGPYVRRRGVGHHRGKTC